MPKIFELKQDYVHHTHAAEALFLKAAGEKRGYTDEEASAYNSHIDKAKAINEQIKSQESISTLRQYDPVSLLTGGLRPKGADSGYFAGAEDAKHITPENPQAAFVKRNFRAWMGRAVGNLTGMNPPESPEGAGAGGWDTGMSATAPSGVISVGSGSGLDSVNFAVATQVLPFMKSYFAFSPFEKAGASIISTDHMRPINVPVVSAGATPSSYSEGQGPAGDSTGSQPMGLTGFTMGAAKRSRQVIATWESLQSTEQPLQPMIIDELLTAIANAQTQDATTALYSALTAPPNVTIGNGALAPLQVGGSSVQADVYGQLTGLRHSLVEGLDEPTNSFMLSRSTLAIIRNTRASTSGVPMFDPDKDLILGRPYTVNEFFDNTCGAGFVAYGNWNKGAFLRRTPILTRVLQEMYWRNSEIGFMVTSWADNHFLAELVGATNPPTYQSLYYTVLPSGALA